MFSVGFTQTVVLSIMYEIAVNFSTIHMSYNFTHSTAVTMNAVIWSRWLPSKYVYLLIPREKGKSSILPWLLEGKAFRASSHWFGMSDF